MSKVVSDFQTMVWQIIGYKRFQKIFEQQIPLTEADEATISAMVKNLAAQHLTPDEVEKGLAYRIENLKLEIEIYRAETGKFHTCQVAGTACGSITVAGIQSDEKGQQRSIEVISELLKKL